MHHGLATSNASERKKWGLDRPYSGEAKEEEGWSHSRDKGNGKEGARGGSCAVRRAHQGEGGRA